MKDKWSFVWVNIMSQGHSSMASQVLIATDFSQLWLLFQGEFWSVKVVSTRGEALGL